METKILEQLASLVLPKEILDRFAIVKIETDEQNIDAMSMTIHLDERMNTAYQESDVYESLGFMEAVSVTVKMLILREFLTLKVKEFVVLQLAIEKNIITLHSNLMQLFNKKV